jgi:tyrosine-protein phosphatase SIW14
MASGVTRLLTALARTVGFAVGLTCGCGGATSLPHADASFSSINAERGSQAVPVGGLGLSNTYQVSETLYRGAQPTPDGFLTLRRLGVRTIVNLRLHHSDLDEIRASGVGPAAFGYAHIRMAAWDADEEEVLAFLRIATAPARAPVFVHCEHGSDRTGTMVAAYRIVVQGWSKDAAIRELRDGPFGFHWIWQGLPRFIQRMNVARYRRELGLPPAPLPR